MQSSGIETFITITAMAFHASYPEPLEFSSHSQNILVIILISVHHIILCSLMGLSYSHFVTEFLYGFSQCSCIKSSHKYHCNTGEEQRSQREAKFQTGVE
jgi:hypothetical protein